MVRTGKRHIKKGEEFDRFFKPSRGEFITVEKEANLEDTLALMKQVVLDTLDDTKRIALKMQGASVQETCKRIWDFCFSHFQYTKDEERKEQVRRPTRSWRDRIAGIDCDCFTVFIGSILTNLGIPFKMRMTRYQALDFEHIYPVAESPKGDIIIDCVVHRFNYEVPYTAKKDVKMELQYLNGVPGERFNDFGDKVHFENDLPIDAQDLFLDESELDGLEGKAERQARKAKRKTKRAKKKAVRKATPLKDKIRKGFHVLNRLNPGAALLRAGILASMKLNLFKVASNLRFAYWSDADAQRNSMDMGKFAQLKKIREKIEKIYYGAGGKTGSLRKAILTGKGNRNKMVNLNGLGAIISLPSDHDDLRTILGDELFSEELNGFDGLNGFGEPASIATGAAITAATGVLGTIAALIKKLGGMFKKGSKSAEKFKIQDNTDNAEEKTRKFSIKNLVSKVREKVQDRRARKAGETTQDETGLEPIPELPEDEFILDEQFSPTRSQESDFEIDNNGETDSGGGFKGWYQDNKVLFWGITGGVAVAGTALTIYLVKKNKKKKGKSLSGVSKKKKSGAKKTASKSKRKFTPKSRGRRKPARTTTVKKVELL